MSKPIRIILIDDNKIDIIVNSKLLKLSSLDSEIEMFSSAREAEEFMSSASSDSHFNVMLLDIQMPINGFDSLDFLLEKHPAFLDNTIVLMLSSSMDSIDNEKAEAHPKIIRILEKPLDIYLLQRIIEAYKNTSN
ncbi:MAG: response regulator [Flavobacteriales bacterium]|nr:response regulator [Flavobacteriales bacterium]